MLQIEREEQILQLLATHSAMRVGQLASALYTSEATVRRDLASLAARGLVRRVYGGVMLEKDDLPLEARRQENAAAKSELASRAAALLCDGDTVFLDSSSTVLHLLPHLGRFQNLTVITNSHRIAEALAGGRFAVFCTGGELVSRNMAYVGGSAERMLCDYGIDIAFMSSQGVSDTGEVTDTSEKETSLRRAVLRRATRRVLLCDFSKAGKKFLYHLCDLKDFTDVVTDSAFPADILSKKG